jgi:peptidyl-prolyl cis-trans isomerase SurA
MQKMVEMIEMIKKTYIEKIKCLMLCIMMFFAINCLFGVVTVESAEVVDRIVAIVNNDIIALSELNTVLTPYTAKIQSMRYPLEKQRQMLYKVREELLNKLIDQTLTDQEVKRLKVSVSEREIDSSIERVKEASYYTDEDLREALNNDGFSMDEYREKVKEQILRAKLVNIAIKSKVIITTKDIKKYYDQHPEIYGGNKKYHLWNILIPTPSFTGKSGMSEIKKEMNGIYKKLNAGEAFTTLAKTRSDGSKAKGRDLGLFRISALAPQLQDAIKELKPGEYTSVLETDQGYQIFFVQEIKNADQKALKDVAAEIESKLFNSIVEEKYNSWLKDLRKTSHIKICL